MKKILRVIVIVLFIITVSVFLVIMINKDTNEKVEDKKDEKIELKDSERQPCEVWTRVMGYHRPVSSFNTGKKGEFYERKCFVESKCGLDK